MRCKPGGTTEIFYPKDYKDNPYQIRNFGLFCNTTFKCSGGKIIKYFWIFQNFAFYFQIYKSRIVTIEDQGF